VLQLDPASCVYCISQNKSILVDGNNVWIDKHDQEQYYATIEMYS
jgi:hypothetical protein